MDLDHLIQILKPTHVGETPDNRAPLARMEREQKTHAGTTEKRGEVQWAITHMARE